MHAESPISPISTKQDKLIAARVLEDLPKVSEPAYARYQVVVQDELEKQ
jgi:hypothetical protein